MFNGTYTGNRRVDLSGRKPAHVARQDLLEKARLLRIARDKERKSGLSSVKIQAVYRSHRIRRLSKALQRAEFDVATQRQTSPDVDCLRLLLTRINFFYNPSMDYTRLLHLCELVVASFRNSDHRYNYCSLLEADASSQVWVWQMSCLIKMVLPLLSSGVPILITAVFLIFHPEYWPVTFARGVLCSRQIIDFAAKQARAVLEFRLSIFSNFPLGNSASISPDLSNINMLLVKSCLKFASDPYTSIFVRDILTIPALIDRIAFQVVTRTMSSPQILRMFYQAIIDERGAILSEISSLYADSGNPGYPAIGWLMGNILQVSAPFFESEKLDPLLFAALSTILTNAPKNIFPVNAPTDSDDEDEIDNGEFFVDSMPSYLGQQLSLLVDRKFLNAIVNNIRDSRKRDDTGYLAITKLLYEVLRGWKSAQRDILSAITFGTPIVRLLWEPLRQTHFQDLDLKWFEENSPSLTLFCLSYSHYLRVIDDDEFYVQEYPLPLKDVVEIVVALRVTLVKLYWTDEAVARMQPWALYQRSAAAATFQQLRDRQSRKPFAAKDIFVMDQQTRSNLEAELPRSLQPLSSGFADIPSSTGSQVSSIRCMTILKEVPLIVPFQNRVQIFYQSINAELNDPYYHHGASIRIRRDCVVEDAFTQLSAIGANIQGRIRIRFVDDFGLPEHGIDGGGLWKEFVNVFCKQFLDPSTGMFKETEDHTHYPSPASSFCRVDHLELIRFFGLIIGKVLCSRIQIEPRFANFFLRKLTGAPSCIDDLRSMDPEISKNLLFLKRFDGDFDDLGLFFCVINDDLGQKQVVELCPHGSTIPVSKANRLAFMHQLADYKLNRQISYQCSAFLTGLDQIIPRKLLQMFSPDELQMLISGSKSAIDLGDMKAHTSYTGFASDDPLISWFWQVLESMSDEDLSLTLRFFTSCSRGPLLGFSTLNPGLCIQKSSDSDCNSLPTSSTCVNMMRLPPYTSLDQLRQKLTYAIRSNAGFNLS